MVEVTFQKQILNRLDRMEKRIDCILEYIEDTKLTKQEKKLLGKALNDHKRGRLLTSQEVFG